MQENPKEPLSPAQSEATRAEQHEPLVLQSMDHFLNLLDQQLAGERRQMLERIKAWAGLLDASGWCVALKLDETDEYWFGDQAREWLARGREWASENDSETWDALQASLPERLIQIREPLLLVWRPDDVASELGQNSHTEPKHPANSTDNAVKGLTRRQKEVLSWVTSGKTNSEIAIILGCSVRTVEKHVENIFKKTGTHSRNDWIL